MPEPTAHALQHTDDEQDNSTDPLLTSETFEKYADVEHVEEALPMASYATLIAVYSSAFCLLVAAAKKKDETHHLQQEMGLRDLFVFSLAVFHTSRTISKGWITIPLRAAFAKYEGPSALPSEVQETARGTGLRRVVGELVTCPFCLGTWTGLGFGYGWVFAPRATRLLTGIAAMGAISNFLHLAYTFACKKTNES